MTKDVKIKIVSRVYDLQQSDLIEAYMEKHPDCSPDEISERFEVSCRGVLECTDGRLSLRYDEPPSHDMGATHTEISFDVSDPGSVTLERTGQVCSMFVYDERIGRRVYLYETPVMTFDMGIATKSLVNRLTEKGGTLHVDYKIDMQSLNMERTVIDIAVKVI